ncbi:phospholipase D family protein, partial [Klebsiella pneumoniae]|nr:phospholipase D family protein [Klebsiella pneumoniae]
KLKPNPLFGLLEEMIAESKAKGRGVFHPKIWTIRFINPETDEVMYRLVVLSRNLTTDSSWDLSLQLDGYPVKRKQSANKALVHLFSALPKRATGKMAKHRRAQAQRFADELLYVEWECPAGFDEVAFFLPGEGYDWQPPEADRAVVISPFCTDEALQHIVKHCQQADALISRPDTLLALSEETRGLFTRQLHLDDAAEEQASDENTHDDIIASGLHAKAYLFENGRDSELVLGSANATNAALLGKTNCEILVSLKGKKKHTGTIDDLLSSDGMESYLQDFDPAQPFEPDVLRVEAESHVEQARALLADAELTLHCHPGENDQSWALWLVGEIPELPGIVQATAWPVTVSDGLGCSLLAPADGNKRALGEFSVPAITGLTAFSIKTSHPDVSVRFVLNLPIDALPPDRHAMILQSSMQKQDFLRYLLMLIGEAGQPSFFAENAFGDGHFFTRLASGEEFAVLEELTRIYSREPERLKDIAALIGNMRKGQSDMIPQDFLALWAVFESAMGGRNGR